MSSSQQPPAPLSASDDPATYQRLGVPIPRILQVRELQEYKDWVKGGGLERFAKAHNVAPNFLDHLCDIKPKVVVAFYSKLTTMPGLESTMAPPPRSSSPFTLNGLQVIQDDENGWTSEDDTEDEEDGKQADSNEKLKVGKEETGVAANASH